MRSASVGVAGSTPGDFISLSDLGLNATYSTTTEMKNISSRAANGRTFTFTPSGTPTATRPAGTRNTLVLTPNPAHDLVKVQGHDLTKPLEIVDAQGRLVRTVPAAAAVELRGLAPGLYLLRSGARYQRLVIE